MAQIKEQIKAPKTELSNEDRTNLSDVELERLVIRMLTGMVECSCKIEGKVKAMKSKIKGKVQGTRVTERKPGLKGLQQKEEIYIQLGQNEDVRIQKNE